MIASIPLSDLSSSDLVSDFFIIKIITSDFLCVQGHLDNFHHRHFPPLTLCHCQDGPGRTFESFLGPRGPLVLPLLGPSVRMQEFLLLLFLLFSLLPLLLLLLSWLLLSLFLLSLLLLLLSERRRRRRSDASRWSVENL